MRMKPFNMKLSDEDRVRLEAHRAALGLRSHADVVRQWIASPITAQRVVEPPNLPDVRQKAPIPLSKPVTSAADVQVGPVRPDYGSRLKKPKGKAP